MHLLQWKGSAFQSLKSPSPISRSERFSAPVSVVLSPRFQALDPLLLKDVCVVRLSLLQDLYCGVPDLNQLVLGMLLRLDPHQITGPLASKYPMNNQYEQVLT